jgi:mannosyltransferase
MSAIATPPPSERVVGSSSTLGEPQRGRWRHVDPAIAAVTILGFALASYRLGTKSMWLDEATSANHARLGLSGLWTVLSSSDPNMGLYYVLLHFWVRVFGYSEAAVRSMTVVLAGWSVPVMVLLGKRLFGRATGLLAGLLLAISPFFVQYEQTARSYALVVLLVLLSSYFFVAELEKPARATRAAYVLSSSLAVYAHYFAAYVLLVQLLTLLAVKRRGALTRGWLTAGAAVAVLCTPEVVFSLRAGSGNVSWLQAPSLSTLAHLPSELAGGVVLAVVLIVLVCYGFTRAAADREEWQAGFLAAWLVIPVILDFAVSKVIQPLFQDYYLIVVLPPLLLLAAVGVAKLPQRAAQAIAIGLLVVLSAVGIRDWYTAPGQENYRGAARYILNNERPGDGVIYYPGGGAGGKGVSSGFVYYDALDGKHGPTRVQFQLGQAPLVRPPRLWLVLRNSDVAAEGPHRKAQVESSVSGTYRQIGSATHFRNLTLVLYGRKGGGDVAQVEGRVS